MEKNKLFVLVDETLEPIYGCVQGGHVVAQWLMEHPNNDWNNNYLIYLRANIDKWRNRLDMLDIDYSEFKEPDLDGRITAIAVHHQGNLFKNLKTIKN